jgi:hypothetical protein
VKRRPGEKTSRELDREAQDVVAAEAALERGDVYASLMPSSDDYEVVARAVPAARAHRTNRWTAIDREGLARVIAYAKGFAAHRGLTPTYPRLVPSGDARLGYVYHALESRQTADPTVGTFSSYDHARAAEAVARQAALELGISVPGMEGSERRRGRMGQAPG